MLLGRIRNEIILWLTINAITSRAINSEFDLLASKEHKFLCPKHSEKSFLLLFVKSIFNCIRTHVITRTNKT